jgi:putative hemolysin
VSTLAIERPLVEHLHREAGEVMHDIAGRNYVRVTVHRAQEKGKRWTWGAELIHDTRTDGGMFALLPSLVMMDQVRMLAGRKPMFLDAAVKATGGDLRSLDFNLRPNIGTDYVAAQLGGAASTTVAKNIALTNNTSAPAATDTSTTTGTALAWGTAAATDAAASATRGEYTALGVARAAAAYAHTTGGTASFSQTKQFTATGVCTALQACGMFDSLTQGAGNLFVENTFTATSLAVNDQLTIAWTINI